MDVLGLHTQGNGSYSGVDAWETVTLPKGAVVYGGVPGQNGYYFPEETLTASGGSKKSLWESLQVEAHPQLGYRENVQKYILNEDVRKHSVQCIPSLVHLICIFA